MKVVLAVDLFCGAGGASTGFIRACEELGLEYFLVAINHWDIAILTHAANHPLRCKKCGWSTTAYPSPDVCPTCHTDRHFRGVKHLCMAIDTVNPRKVVPGGRLHLLIAGPECTHHSTARGGRPINEQSRATAWHILKWAQELYIDTILIENVPEFRNWAPVGVTGRPLKRRKGETYRAYLDALRSLDNRVEERIINCANHGDATTRRRLFIMARRRQHQIVWPEATHSPDGGRTLFGQTKKWRGAREVIDWNLKGKSIFRRKKPLKPATMRRILAGLKKFGGPALQPFIVAMEHGGRVCDVDKPLPTITTAKGGAFGVVDFVLGQHGGATARPADEPLPTIATDGAIRVGEAFIVRYHGEKREGDGRVESLDEPVPALTTENRFGLAEPFLVPMYGERPTQDPRTHSVEEPVPTIPASGGGKFGVVEPFIITPGGANLREPRGTSEPLPTVTGSDRFAVVEPFILPNNTNNQPRSVDEPVPTITTGPRNYVVEPFILQQQSNGAPRATDQPLPTIATAGKQALVEPIVIHATHGRDANRARSTDDPLPTVTGANRGELAVVEPFLTKYNRTATGAYSVDEPVDTISTRDRFGLVQPVIDGYTLDIRFRMLQPHELAAATSFPKGYVFKGKKEDVVKQIGNAWPGETAKALCLVVVRDLVPARKRRAWQEEATA